LHYPIKFPVVAAISASEQIDKARPMLRIGMDTRVTFREQEDKRQAIRIKYMP
jgi:hypothetical protein